MGLFGRSKKNQQGDTHADAKASKKAAKAPKQKKVKGGKKKKDMTLFERMQLEESVAAASLDVVQDLASRGGSAIREVDEGLLIIAVTNQMLEETGIDHTSEEFGSFAEALRSETVESIALAGDLAEGIIGIIPSEETLIALDEFDFAHEMPFKWAIVPFDLRDEDRLTLLDSTVHIERLIELSNHQDIQLHIDNGQVVETDVAAYEEDNEPELEIGGPEASGFENDFGEQDAPDSFDNGGFSGVDDGVSDAGFEDDFGQNDAPFDDDFESENQAYEDDFGGDNPMDDDHDPSFDYHDLDSGDPNAVDYGNVDEGMTAEESNEAVNRLANHTFNNTELDLSIDMTKFDDYFDSLTLAQFDTSRHDGSELQNVLSKLRQDANTELLRFHQDNVQSLRNKFTTNARDIYNRLVESLDHKDQNTTYGSRHHEIETDFEDKMDDIERFVAVETGKINENYNEQREEYAENARREALAVYDSRYRDERNRKVESVKDTIQSDFKTERDTELGELYKDRRTVAQRLFDKAMTTLLQKLQEEYQMIAQNELHMYDAFRKDMDVYLRKHYADEVLRAKAEAEKMKQSHEAERVRQEYEQMLITKARQLEEADERSRVAVQQLDGAHKEQLEQVRMDYERRIEREQRDNQNMRDMLQDATQSNSKVIEQKEKEIEHRLRLYEDTIASKDKELEYANKRANGTQKQTGFIIGAVAAVTLAVGIIFGFLFGATSATQQIAPQAPESVNDNSVSFNYQVPTGIDYGLTLNTQNDVQDHAA